MIGFSRRKLVMMTNKDIQEKYVTNVRLGRGVKELKEALIDRGIVVPEGSNPRSLVK